MTNIVYAEAEAAAKLTDFLHREFGLTDCVARAELRRGVLVVLFQNALSPVGQVLMQSEEGERAIQSVFRILYAANRERMHALISRIVGFAVRRSHLETDTAAARILLTFQWEQNNDGKAA